MTAIPHNDVELPAIGLPRAIDLLRTSSFTGRDPENLVTAVVDGDGMVDRITFATTVTHAGRRPWPRRCSPRSPTPSAGRRGVDGTDRGPGLRPAPSAPASSTGSSVDRPKTRREIPT